MSPPFNKYVYPNGCLSAISQVSTSSEKLIMERQHIFGAGYCRNLMA